MKYSVENIADNLKYWLAEKRIVQKSVAEALFISTQAFNHYVKGERIPPIDRVCELADVLEITPNDLLVKRDYKEEF